MQTRRATIALDTAGGDNAPHAPLAAAAALSLAEDAIDIVLVGDPATIAAGLGTHAHNPARLRVVPAARAVAMDADPRTALDAAPDASILVAARVVSSGEADALVSAGNTGAVVLACARTWQRLAGVKRCALGAVYPTERGAPEPGGARDPFSLILDAGLTVAVDAEDLVTFAVMGAAYAARITRSPRPRVALLSNGTEANKGTDAIVQAHAVLRRASHVNFIGNIEGLDIPKGTADVIVTDGFTGNIVLKMLEGVADTAQSLLRYAFDQSLANKAALALLGPTLRELKTTTDWQQYGGAPILGFDRVCIKAHGRSNARALRNALKLAAKSVNANAAGDTLIDAIRRGLQGVPTAG